MATKTKRRQTRGQGLLDAVSHAASCLKEAGEPLQGLGPSAQYAAAFDRYASALRELVSFECPLHIADWAWNGHEGTFRFYWEFGVKLVQPGSSYEHHTRFMAMRVVGYLDPVRPLAEELARLRAEAAYYDELRGAVLCWSREARSRSFSPLAAGGTS